MTMAHQLIPVAQYLRMSTEHQQYSLDNQEVAMQAYAALHGFSVVQTYSDAAKSGVVLKHRDGLRQLLKDVVSGTPGYKAILVYDISRWGRFQDADEAAHYEFLCKSAGVPIHYCAEIFANDGTLPNMLLKALKRSMAGEYSRELGVKVLAGLARLAHLGFKQGGSPGYGLRRMLVSPERQPKFQLAAGERKSITTDRVILVPGPSEEVECVKEIYRMFTEANRSVHGIAMELNRRGTKYLGNTQWDYTAVYSILTHPKYSGCNRFGRTSQKLGTAQTQRPKSEWIFTPKAFPSIVEESTFQEAQRLLSERTINRSNEELLERLRSLLATHGRLSIRIMTATPEIPSPSVYRSRFGSIRKAYGLIGYGSPHDFEAIDLRRRTQAIRENLMEELLATFPTQISIVRRGGRRRSQLRLTNDHAVSVLVCRSIPKNEFPTWSITPAAEELQCVTLLAFLDIKNTTIQEMYLFPNLDRTNRFHVTADNVWMKRGIHIGSLTEFLVTMDEISVLPKSHECADEGLARTTV
jgi:DNA invertase Pin-like site-specific DNA recombinase